MIQEDEVTTRQTMKDFSISSILAREEPPTNILHQQLPGTFFECGSCQKAFTTALYLDGHQKLCSARNGPGLTVRTDLTSLGRDSYGVTVYHCPYCTYNTTHSGNLRRHLMSHTGTRPFQCEVCRKRFIRKNDLTRHRKIHTGHKPYKCARCSYSSSHTASMKIHMSKHIGEAMFTCRECSFSTAVRGAMTRHTMTHTGEKPYKCHLCEYSATRKDHLTKHVGRIHK